VGRAVMRALRRDGLAATASGQPAAGELLSAALLADDAADTLVWCAGGRGEDARAMWRAHVESAGAAVGALPALRSVVYVSSGEIYGAQTPPFVEKAARLGTSAYARAKMRGEDAMAALCWPRGLALAIVRPAVVYGPGQAAGMLVPSAIARLRGGQELAVTAGAQTRDWIFVDDVAAGIAAAVTRRAEGVFNLGSGREVTVREMISTIAAAVGGDAAARVRWGALPYRDGEPMRYALCERRARAQLGVGAEVSLADGLAACVAAAEAAEAGTAGAEPSARAGGAEGAEGERG
jgi:nucleoside-diphosphate-sugar epimerase